MKIFKLEISLFVVICLFSGIMAGKAGRQYRLKTQSREMMHVIANNEAHADENTTAHSSFNHHPVSAKVTPPNSHKIVIDSSHPCYGNCMKSIENGTYHTLNTDPGGVYDNSQFSHDINNYEPKGIVGTMFNGINSMLVGGTALASNGMLATAQLNSNLSRSQHQIEIQEQQLKKQQELDNMRLQHDMQQQKYNLNSQFANSARRGPYVTKSDGAYYQNDPNDPYVVHNHPINSRVYYKKRM